MKLRYTRPALADLDAILEYISAQSPRGARHVQSRIRTVIDLVLVHPAIGLRTDDPSIRRLVASPFGYLIFYEATDTEIIIHAIRHGARSPSSMPGLG